MPEVVEYELDPAVLIADEFVLRRAGIVNLLQEWAGTHSVTLYSADLPDFSAKEDIPPKCCLCILSIGSTSLMQETASEWLKQLTDRFPVTPWVVLSDRTEPVEAVEALKQGARGFIPTSMTPELVRQALSFILGGGTFFPPEALTAQTAAKPRKATPSDRRRSGTDSDPAAYFENLGAPWQERIDEDGYLQQVWAQMARSIIWPDFRPRTRASKPLKGDAGTLSGSATVLAFPADYRTVKRTGRRPK